VKNQFFADMYVQDYPFGKQKMGLGVNFTADTELHYYIDKPF
jgi:hypothetical protein